MQTAKAQSKLTPDKVFEILKKGNDDFINNRLTVKNNPERVRNAAKGQCMICTEGRLNFSIKMLEYCQKFIPLHQNKPKKLTIIY